MPYQMIWGIYSTENVLFFHRCACCNWARHLYERHSDDDERNDCISKIEGVRCALNFLSIKLFLFSLFWMRAIWTRKEIQNRKKLKRNSVLTRKIYQKIKRWLLFSFNWKRKRKKKIVANCWESRNICWVLSVSSSISEKKQKKKIYKRETQ